MIQLLLVAASQVSEQQFLGTEACLLTYICQLLEVIDSGLEPFAGASQGGGLIRLQYGAGVRGAARLQQGPQQQPSGLPVDLVKLDPAAQSNS